MGTGISAVSVNNKDSTIFFLETRHVRRGVLRAEIATADVPTRIVPPWQNISTFSPGCLGCAIDKQQSNRAE